MVSELEDDPSSAMAAGDRGENHPHDPACNEMTSCQTCKISQKPHQGRTPREHVHYNKEQDPKNFIEDYDYSKEGGLLHPGNF